MSIFDQAWYSLLKLVVSRRFNLLLFFNTVVIFRLVEYLHCSCSQYHPSSLVLCGCVWYPWCSGYQKTSKPGNHYAFWERNNSYALRVSCQNWPSPISFAGQKGGDQFWQTSHRLRCCRERAESDAKISKTKWARRVHLLHCKAFRMLQALCRFGGPLPNILLLREICCSSRTDDDLRHKLWWDFFVCGVDYCVYSLKAILSLSLQMELWVRVFKWP